MPKRTVMKRTSSAPQKLLQLTYRFVCFALIVFAFVYSRQSHAFQPTSLHQPHPLGWMHYLPVGEQPGWQGEKWAFVELSNSNVWSAPLKMKNSKTGDIYQYRADYEQISAIAEIGSAVNKKLAVSMELPFAYRAGGMMDGMIDSVHDQLGTRTFNREMYGRNEYHYSIKTNGKEYVTDGPLKSLSNIKPKIKYWFRQSSSKKNSCPCGLAVSAQLKIPMINDSYGSANSKLEPSLLFHYGAPMWTQSAVWFTAALTKSGSSPQLPNWPTEKVHQMYELSFDLGITNKWGVLFQARMDSPFLDAKQVEYVDSTNSTNSRDYVRARAATAWNSLVRWQGMEAAGVRYRDKKTQVNFLIAEDWGSGNYDAADNIYSNNAPDINFVLQTAVTF